MGVLKTSRVVYVFQVLCIIETKSRFPLIKYSVPKYSVSCKKGVLKIEYLQNLLKNIRGAVFNLIKFYAKGLQLY